MGYFVVFGFVGFGDSEVVPMVRFVPCAACTVLVVLVLVLAVDGGVLDRVESFIVPFVFERLCVSTSESLSVPSNISSGIVVFSSSPSFRVVGCSSWIGLNSTFFLFQVINE